MRPLKSVLFFGTAMLMGWPLPAAALTTAGKSSAVSADTSGTPPGEARRSLQVGTEVYEQERVVTGPSGPAQLLFLDGSSATVGAGGELLLDSFVYDKSSEAGKLALNLAGGAMRFVGGRISKGEAVTVKTPTATVGIRGGVAAIRYDPQTGETFVFKQYGVSIDIAGTSGPARTITANGFGVIAGRTGVGAVNRWTPQQIRDLNAAIESNIIAQDNGVSGRETVLESQPSGDSGYILPDPPHPDPNDTVDTVRQERGGTKKADPATPSLGTTSVSLTFARLNGSIQSVIAGNGTFGSDNLLTGFDIGASGTISLGTATRKEYGGTAFLQWARWSGGVIAASGIFTGTAVPANSGYHMLVGTPTVTLPGSGSVTYTLMGATNPTFSDGAGTPGTFTGSMTAIFSTTVHGVISGTATMPSDGSYSFSANYSTSSATFGGSATVSGSGRACGSGNCTSTSMSLQGFFAGSGAQNAGIVYRIGNGSTSIEGAAAFKQP